jgi:hypothetical protein
MPTTATILEPRSNDTVPTPVRVVAAYSTDATFNMFCSVGTTNEGSPQSHTPGSDIHTTPSSEIPALAGTHAVAAKKMGTPAPLHELTGVIVTDGALPIEVEGIEEPPSPPGPPVKGNRRAKKRKLTGKCHAAANPLATHVICLVEEVDITTHLMARVTSGAGSVLQVGPRRKWVVDVDFEMDTVDQTLQYIARITAFDKNGNALGTITKHITK